MIKKLVYLMANKWKQVQGMWEHPALPGERLTLEDAVKVQWLAEYKRANGGKS